MRSTFRAERLGVFAGALLLGINSCIIPEQTTSLYEKRFKLSFLNNPLQQRKVLPFCEEVADSIHQQEHLFLSLGAVSRVEIMLQRHRSLHRADHVNMPLLYATRNEKLMRESGKRSKDTKNAINIKSLCLIWSTYPIHSLNSRAFGTVALRRMMLT